MTECQIDNQFAVMGRSVAGRTRQLNEFKNRKTYGATAVGATQGWRVSPGAGANTGRK